MTKLAKTCLKFPNVALKMQTVLIHVYASLEHDINNFPSCVNSQHLEVFKFIT